MAGRQVSGDAMSPSLAGMSKNQLYDIMSQMKTLIEQNRQQARQILIQNPSLTKALFQAQIMLGMVQSPQAASTVTAPASLNSQQNVQERKQQPNMLASSSSQSQSAVPSNPLSMPSQLQQPKGALSVASQPTSLLQPTTQISTQLQQPIQTTGSQYLPLQSTLQPPARPPIQGYPHQAQAQVVPSVGFQPSQHMFRSATKPPTNLGPLFQMGQSPYQAGSPHLGIDSTWPPGLHESNISSQLPPPPLLPPYAAQAGPSSQLPRPSTAQQLTPELEKALLQQVMSLTPEQINMLPPDQRNQIWQLQQALRQ